MVASRFAKPPADTEMPSQSPAAGALLVPSASVSPARSSRSEVNETGVPATPAACRTPLTAIPTPAAAFTTVPGSTVRVIPAGTTTGQVSRWTEDADQDWSVARVPQRSMTAGTAGVEVAVADRSDSLPAVSVAVTARK